ncbi:hypothetical protein L210DRAFT_980231 [Boletus edulis BED1]|uniref:Uncharacterized protein n=1 Tax=Boletus edulis BED1 TaxID=1328754 RepID=A0AAD4GB83_BOLED|nr:hypothetical protein L210DRAFT_980231 [Boletus edulis BED1]
MSINQPTNIKSSILPRATTRPLMFRRPAGYHPYRPSVPLSPAGFRLGDYVPRRCFNLFQGPGFGDARSPDPSPLTSPIRGARCSGDDAPPTIRLGDLFSSRRPNPNPVPGKDALPFPHRRKTKHGPKHLSFSKNAHGSGVIPQHRRSQQLKEKRDAFRKQHGRRVARSRSGLCRLQREAETLMKPRHMNSEDRIFLEQLGNIAVDHQMEDGLEEWRKRMARAAQETDQRRNEHEARDAEAAKLWEVKKDEVLEDKRGVGEDEKKEAEFRRLEEEAIRADMERQRAHEAAERMLREEQERLLRKTLARKALEEERQRQEEQERRLREERERQRREEITHRLQEETRQLRAELERMRQEAREHQQREEQARKLREEVERLRREAHERYLRDERERLAREEQERQARSRAEEAHRTTMEEQIRQHFVMYEAKWNELRTNNSIPAIEVREMPWPVLAIVSSADQITYQDVRAFLFHPQRPGVEGKSARDKVKVEMLRFHPDKFNTRIVPKIQQAQQGTAQAIAGAVARILTTIMNEEAAQK